MDRWPALVALEWRRRLCREAPSLAPRRPRPRDPADSLDKQSAPKASQKAAKEKSHHTIPRQAA